MLATQIEVSDGTLTTINVGISFFEQTDISVSLDKAIPLTLGVDYLWTNATTIQFLSTTSTPGGFVPNGVEVVVRRDTQNDAMLNTYDGGAPFSRATLDENFKQLLFLAQEFSEGLGLDGLQDNLNMNGYRIINLGNGIVNGDAVNKGQVDTLVAETADAVRTDFTAADASLQDQINGITPPAGSQFSLISWHAQRIENSIAIPDNVNAWSFGPAMTVAPGVEVTIGAGSYWTVASGVDAGPIPDNLDFGEL